MLEEHHLPNVDRILDAVDRLQWDDSAAVAGDRP
jgi:pyruvate dehydrogenase E1 component beta subunit